MRVRDIISIVALCMTSWSCKPGAHGYETNNQPEEMTIRNLKIDIEWAHNVEPGQDAGVSGAFVGVLDGKMIQAGGCNFPVDPLAPASQKKFYEGIYEAELKDSTWIPRRIGTLPRKMAYGLAATLPDGMVLMGGSDASGSFSDVYLLKKKGKEAMILPMPSLPGTLDNFAATSVDSVVYAGGGNFNGKPSNKVFMLNLKNQDEGWVSLPDFPGNPRVQPVMAHGKDSLGHECIYIWGGFAGKGDGRDATLNCDGLKYDISGGEWSHLAAPKNKEGEEVSTGGGCITVLKSGRIAVSGGVNKDIFLAALRNQAPDYLTHPIEWYRFNPNLLIFNPSAETWSVEMVNKELARAGAGMVEVREGILVSGGELKPRIRTSEISVLK